MHRTRAEADGKNSPVKRELSVPERRDRRVLPVREREDLRHRVNAGQRVRVRALYLLKVRQEQKDRFLRKQRRLLQSRKRQ